MPIREMTLDEINQFLTCARVGRIGISTGNGPYVVPVGYVYADNKIFFHTCSKGHKMDSMRENRNVCFEVDESLSDGSMFKSVILHGKVEVVEDRKRMVPYLQKLIDKYRVPLEFDEYMMKIGANKEKELKTVRICIITPKKMTGRQSFKGQ